MARVGVDTGSLPADLAGEQADALLDAQLRIAERMAYVVLATSLIIYMPTVFDVWFHGATPPWTSPGWPMIRDGSSLIFTAYLGLIVFGRLHRLAVPRGLILAGVSFLILYVAAYAFLLQRGYPAIIGIYGIRFIQFMPFAFLFFALSKRYGERVLHHLGYLLALFTLVQCFFGVWQIFSIRPVFGSTIFGSRPFGTMPLPHHFGMTMALVSFVFVLIDTRWARWCALACVLMTLTSGSRLGILMAAISTAFYVSNRLETRHRLLKPLLVLVGPLILVLLLMVISDPAISGRETTFGVDGRIGLWLAMLDRCLTDLPSFFLGSGLGLGANATFISFRGQFPEIQWVDSFVFYILGSFGFPGLFLLFGTFFALLRAGNRYSMPWVMAMVGMCAVSFTAFELFPINAILYTLMGWALGDRGWRPHARVELERQAFGQMVAR